MIEKQVGQDGPHHPGMAYRPDIDGLRALAVLPILFNHVGLRGFAGGYVGVDIFFVISGFLITSILLRDLDRGHYSLAAFYRRRVLRIFPALFAMLAIVSIVSLPIMMPGEMVRFAKSVLGATFFSSNFVFYFEAGYFDTASHSKPLLHTWSLGIEEQFYILWPLILAFTIKAGRRPMIGAMLCLVFASFLFSLWQVPRDMTGAFYLLPARAWELGLGGLVAVAPVMRWPRWLREGLAGLGVLLILIAIWRFFPPIAFPGLTALVPCGGTALLLLFAPGTIVGRLLSLSPMTFVGQISYSLYLWHWPVIVLSQIGLFLHPTAPVMAGQIVVSLILAILSWRWIERPFRSGWSNVKNSRVLAVGGIAMASATVAGGVMLMDNGLASRFTPAEQRLASYADQDYEARFRRGTCFIIEATDTFDRKACLAPDTGKPSILLVGDSMAAHYWPGLVRYQGQFDISQATIAGCRPNIYPVDTDRRCELFFRQMLLNDVRTRKPSVVVLSGNWQPMDMALLRESLPQLKRAGVPILLLGPVPQYGASLPRLLVSANRLAQPDLVRESLLAQTFDVDREMAGMAKDAGISYYSPIGQLCKDRRCRTYAKGNIPVQFDYGHLSPAGSALVVDGFMASVKGMLPQERVER